MKGISLVVLCALWLGGLNAQTRTTNKNTKSSTQAPKVNNRKNTINTNNNDQPGIRDRINRRLRDSADANNNTATTTVINGITVPSTSTAKQKESATTPVNSNMESNPSTTTSGGNSVTNTGVQLNQPIPGTIPSTPSNPSNIPGKPATREQVRSNTTDINRVQMNAINGNQAASQAQNPDNPTKTTTGNMMGESQWESNQVGENQWTPPNAIISGFTRDFPAVRGAAWTRDNAANTFSARYRNGNYWTSSTYSETGTQLETRTELPIVGTLPEPVATFRSKQSAVIDLNRISRIDRPGRETIYEVRLNTGRVAYVNNRGLEVPFQ